MSCARASSSMRWGGVAYYHRTGSASSRTVDSRRCPAAKGWIRCVDARDPSLPRCARARSAANRGCRGLVKLNEPDQYDDAELVRKKTAAMFAGLRHARANPEDNLMGEGAADDSGIALGAGTGTLQILEPGGDIKFSDPADVGGSYSEFRTQFRVSQPPLGVTYEQLTGDLTGVNYSSIRGECWEFRRRCEMAARVLVTSEVPPGVGAAWMKQGRARGRLDAAGLRAAADAPSPVPAGEADSTGLAVGRSGERGDVAGHPCGIDVPLEAISVSATTRTSTENRRRQPARRRPRPDL